MHKKRFTLARIKDGVIIEEFKGTFAEAFLAPHGEEVLVTAANAHGIIRADKSGNAVLEEIHAHR